MKLSKKTSLIRHIRLMHSDECEPLNCTVGECNVIYNPIRSTCQATEEPTDGLHQVEDQLTRCSALAVDQGPCKAVNRTNNNYSDNNSFKRKCTICFAKFTDLIDLESHKKLHMPLQSWLCGLTGLCSETFETESNLRSHYSEHRRDNTFSCTFCSFKDQTFTRFTSHIRKHTGERPFACTICSRTFKELKELKRHILALHKGVNVYRCDLFSMKFNRDQEELYKLHRESHTDQQPFACTECDKRWEPPQLTESCQVCAQERA